MVAMMIALYGYDKTELIIQSWVKNFSMKPTNTDIDVINAILDNKADIGIVNSYYLAKMINENPSLPIKMHFIGDKDKKVHVNISGMGVLRYSKRKDNAVKLIEWLSSKKGQRLFSDIDMEYPVNSAVKPHDILKRWGKFKHMTINVKKTGELRKKAIKLMNDVKYD
jgi:iron(III) transport system substrate-binding protein